jgi:hypothetical protein
MPSILAFVVLAGIPLWAQSPPDAELAAGVRLVEEGDFEKAVVTLDGVARRLKGDPGRVQELGRTHLYLGVAYVGLDQEGKAKAAFREALPHLMVKAQRETGGKAEVKDLTLGAFGFSPKVIQVFESAKREALADKAFQRDLEARLEKEPGRKRSKTGPILLGVGLAGAAGVGLALAGGGPGETRGMPDEIRFVGSDPAPGSTISISGPFPTLTVRASIRYGISGNYQFEFAVEFAGGFAGICDIVGGAPVTLVAGQAQEVSAPADFFPSQDACFPATSPTLRLVLFSADHSTRFLREQVNVSYNWVP